MFQSKSYWRDVFFLFVVGCVATWLRFWNLGTLPVGFASDEVMNGYVGRYILQTGFDPYGNRWPLLYFDHFGDYPNVIPMYLSGIFTYVFGVSEFAVRFPIALFGLLTVLVVYTIGRSLWKPRLPAILAALALAIMPWHVLLSRATAEGITASFVLLLGVLLIMRGRVGWGWICFLTTYLLYPGFRVFAPLAFFPVFFLTQKKTEKIKVLFLSLSLFVVTGLISQTVWGRGRYDQTSLFSYNDVIDNRAVNYSLGLGSGRVLEARLFSNRYILATREFARQYTSYFSPDYLVGEAYKSARYVVPDHGVFYWTFIIIFTIVMTKHLIYPWKRDELRLIFQQGREKYFFWVVWILMVAPIPAALTLDDVPNIHRTVVMAPLLAMLIGFFWNLLFTVKFSKKSVFGLITVVLISLETIYFWHYYSGLHSVVTTSFRNDKQRSLAQWLIDHRTEYTSLYAPAGEGLQMHYLFQTQQFPKDLKTRMTTELAIEKIGFADNVIFVDTDCPSELASLASQSGILVVNKSECVTPPTFTEIGKIKRLDFTDAYTLNVPKVK